MGIIVYQSDALAKERRRKLPQRKCVVVIAQAGGLRDGRNWGDPPIPLRIFATISVIPMTLVFS